MRLLVCVGPAYGHFLPVLPTARALAAAGHEVKVATSATFHPVVEGAGLAVVAAGMSDDDLLAERRRRWPETVGRPASEWAVRMFARIAAPAMLEDVERIVADWRPDLVIHDEGEYGSPVATAAAGIPWVTSGWGSPLRLPAEVVGLKETVLDLWQSRGLAVPPLAGLYRFGVLDPCPVALQPDVEQVPNRLEVRFEPYEPAEGGGPPARPNPPYAYVGFGTTTLYGDPPDLLAAIVQALLEEGLGVVASVADEGLARRLVDLSPGDVRVERFVSLPALLAEASLVVCHGGAGTTLAALAQSVPLLIAPQGSPSQARMASACQRAGAAHIIERGAGIDAISRVVRAATGEETRRRAAAIAAEMAAAAPATSLVPRLEALAASAAPTRRS